DGVWCPVVPYPRGAGVLHRGGALLLADRSALHGAGRPGARIWRFGLRSALGRAPQAALLSNAFRRHGGRTAARPGLGRTFARIPFGILCGVVREQGPAMKQNLSPKERELQIEMVRARAAIERQSMARSVRELG